MANITVSDLYINSKKMPTPALEGVVISREKWPPLTPAQVAVIESAVSDGDKPFVPVKFTDATGVTVTKTMYFGTPTYTVYSWANGRQYLRDVSVTGIEQ